MPSLYATTALVTLTHEHTENSKFLGPNRDPTRTAMTGKTLIQTLTDHRYLLIPCTLDSYGCLGPLFTKYLLGPAPPYSHIHLPLDLNEVSILLLSLPADIILTTMPRTAFS